MAGILAGAENGYRFRAETVRAWFQERLAPEALRAAHGAAGATLLKEPSPGVLGSICDAVLRHRTSETYTSSTAREGGIAAVTANAGVAGVE